MAVIRCQACGKPNPDFLDVCQYCDARLKPLEAGPAPEAAPAGDVIRCQACGKPNPAFTEVCQFCDSPLKPQLFGFGETASAEAGDQIRCQSCGRLNPPFAEACQYCEARLRPLQEIAGDETAGATAAPEPPGSPGGGPESGAQPGMEWMRRLSTEPSAEPDWMWTGAAGEEPEPAAAPSEETPDWMRPFGGEQPAQPAEPPGSPEGGPAMPDWMSSLGGEPTRMETAAPAEEVPDWLRSFGEPPSQPTPSAPAPSRDIPEWLRPPESSEAEAAAPLGETPDWLSTPAQPEAAPPAEEVLDWMRSSGGAPAQPAEAAPPGSPEGGPAFGAEPTSAAEMPDWLSALGGAPAQPEAALPAEEVPDWMRSSGGAPAQPAEAAPPGSPEGGPAFGVEPTSAAEMPDWLSALGGAPAQPAEAAPAFGAEPTPAAEMPDWLSALGGAPADVGGFETRPEAAPADETPDWLRSMGISAPTEPVGAPPEAAEAAPDWLSGLGAPRFAAPAEPTSPFGAFTEIPAEAAPAAGEMPDWLSSLQPATPPEVPGAPEPAPASSLFGAMPSPFAAEEAPTPLVPPAATAGLALGEMPTWLQSMRPVDVQPSRVPPEVDNYEEKVGILAGMRGVLQAEPAIAKPHKSEVPVQKLEVSEAEAAQATLLAGVLKAEAEEARPVSKRRLQIALPVERWLVFAALALAVIFPWFFAAGFFPAPTTIARETNAAFELVEGLPTDKPVLVAFDYDPAQRGELDLAAQAVIFHLMRRGVSLAGVSTHPAGAGVGQDIFNELALGLKNAYGVSYTYGVNYINLGYIPGGPVGLLQFATNPRSLFNTDFSGAMRVWDAQSAPEMSQVYGLSDFSLIVLASSTPDAIRAWIEQTQSFAAAAPVVAVVSAGADPLVRPYYEANPPQIKGMVTGIVGAAQYEQRAGLPGGGPASNRWDAIGGGVLAAVILIIAGNLLGALARMTVLRARKR